MAKVLEMTAEKQEKLNEAQNARENAAPTVETEGLTEDFIKELRADLWSVISFEKCEARDLTYAGAEQKIAQLETGGVSGLCIVTNETAARISEGAI